MMNGTGVRNVLKRIPSNKIELLSLRDNNLTYMSTYKICCGLEETEAEYKRQCNSKNSNVKITYNSPFGDEDVVTAISCTCEQNDKIEGYGLIVLYKPGTMTRCNQWEFGENKQREIWIESLWSINHGGKILLNYLHHEMKSYIQEHKIVLVRNNIYTVALTTANGFFKHCGYEEIITPDHEDDNDYPSSYQYGGELLSWMAYPLNSEIEGETIANFEINEWYLNECIQRGRADMINKILSQPVPNWKCIQSLGNIDEKKDFPFANIKYHDGTWGDFLNDIFSFLIGGAFPQKYFSHELSEKIIGTYYELC